MIDGLIDTETLEALACREGLSSVLDPGLADLKLATDCKGLVTDISVESNEKIVEVIKEIKGRSRTFNRCSFAHEGRLSNMEARHLAKHALTLTEGRRVWLLSPHDINVIPVFLPIDQ